MIRGHLPASRTVADRWLFAATLAFLAWLPLPWGSHRPWATDLLVLVAALLLALRLLFMSAGRIPVPHGVARQLFWPMLWWLLWLTWIGVHLLPVDAATLARWSPAAAQLYDDSARLLGSPLVPRLSIAPSQTIDAWLLSAGLCCLYALIVLSCCGDRVRMGQVLGVIVASGLFQALYGSLMTLSGLEWGFFEVKEHYRRVATGTFVNRNHLAGYLELAGAAALGLILADLGGRGTPRTWRQRLADLIALLFSAKMRARLALIVMAVALVLTRSRMGNIAFVASLCVCAMGFILLRHRHYALRAFALFASVVAVDILIVSNWYGLERVIERIEQTDLNTDSRAVFLRHAPPAVDAYWTAGSGPGTFAVAFSPFRTAELRPYFDHAHNDYIEFLVETGVVGLSLLAAFVLAHVLHALRTLIRRRRRMAAAVSFSALMGMLAIAIHSTADFNLQIPANAATLLTLMALAASCSSASRRRRTARGEPAAEGDASDEMA